MEYDIQFKIRGDKKQTKYLINNSHWYKYLNRNPDNYSSFLEEYKKFNRNEQTQKITNVIDTLETVNQVFKIIN